MTRRDLPRLRIAVEGAVIVASILLAFGIDAWWASRQEAQRSHTILEGLREEFVEHRTALAADLDGEVARKRRLERLFQAIGSNTQLAPATVDTLLFDVTYAPTFDPGSGRLQALIASGEVGLIRNPDLRDHLSGWQGMVDEVRDNQIAMRGFILGEIIPYLASEGVPIIRNRMMDEESFPWPLRSDDEVDPIYRRLLDDPKFESFAKFRYAWLRLDEHEDAIRFADSLLALINTELDRH
jgi:hypothetical protein